MRNNPSQNTPRRFKIFYCLFVAAFLIPVGCEAPPAVLDGLAIRSVRSVVVLPLVADGQGGIAGGVTVAGMVETELQARKACRLTVSEAPVLWRLGPQPPVTDDSQALAIAKDLGVAGVLTGTYSDTLKVSGKEKLPAAVKAAQMPVGSDFKGTVRVRLRLLSVSSGRVIYDHFAEDSDSEMAERRKKATKKAIQPLVEAWSKKEDKQKEESKSQKE